MEQDKLVFPAHIQQRCKEAIRVYLYASAVLVEESKQDPDSHRTAAIRIATIENRALESCFSYLGSGLRSTSNVAQARCGPRCRRERR